MKPQQKATVPPTTQVMRIMLLAVVGEAVSRDGDFGNDDLMRLDGFDDGELLTRTGLCQPGSLMTSIHRVGMMLGRGDVEV